MCNNATDSGVESCAESVRNGQGGLAHFPKASSLALADKARYHAAMSWEG
jgi:hypothetical protein